MFVLEHCNKHRACIFLVIVFSQALSYFRWDEWTFFFCTVSQHLKHFRAVYDSVQSLRRRKSPPRLSSVTVLASHNIVKILSNYSTAGVCMIQRATILTKTAFSSPNSGHISPITLNGMLIIYYCKNVVLFVHHPILKRSTVKTLYFNENESW